MKAGYKTCTECLAEKPYPEFHKTQSGRQNTCKECRNAKSREYSKTRRVFLDRQKNKTQPWWE